MKIEKINSNIKYLYHYTKKENAKKIMQDKKIISKDQYVFFTTSIEDSNNAFEKEMMDENKVYIDNDCKLRKREKCNKQDYCIIKIPYNNDNEFYKFTFENQNKDSIYKVSVAHKGAYYFEKAKVIEFPKSNKKSNIFIKTTIAAVAAGAILFPYNVFAANWLDADNYDISWYSNNTEASKYDISNAKQMAGLAYLVNNENISFSGKNFNFTTDIDLSENNWETIKNIFDGAICGSHRFILNCTNKKLFENKNLNVSYSYKVRVNNSTNLKKYNVDRVATIGDFKNMVYVNEGIRYADQRVFFNNIELDDDTLVLSSLNFGENDVIEVMERQLIYFQNPKGEKHPIHFHSGDSIDNVKDKYSTIFGIPVDSIILKYNEIELADGRTLADYNIQYFSTINVFIKRNVAYKIIDGNGVVHISNSTAFYGDKIEINVQPADEYEIDKVLVNEVDETNNVAKNKLMFNCPDEDVIVKVSFKAKKIATGDSEELDESKKDNNKPDSGKDDKKAEEDKFPVKEKQENEGKGDTKSNEKIETENKNETISKSKEIENPQTKDSIISIIIGAIVASFGFIVSRIKK